MHLATRSAKTIALLSLMAGTKNASARSEAPIHQATPHAQLGVAAAATNSPSSFVLRSALTPNLCLAANASERNSSVELAACEQASTSQRWQRTGDMLRLFGDLCLEVTQGRDREGTSLRMATCQQDNANQQWHIGGGTLHWRDHERCAGFFDAALRAGDAPQMWRCSHALPSQQWRLESVGTPSSAVPAAGSQQSAITCADLGAWPSASTDFEAEVLTRINAHRAKGASCGTRGAFAKQPPLTGNQHLTCLARAFAKDMSDKHYFAHSDLAGRSPFERMKRAGIAYRAAAENIAQGQRTPQDVVESWMQSDGHCANIMGTYKYVGIGFYRAYWVQDFATLQ